MADGVPSPWKTREEYEAAVIDSIRRAQKVDPRVEVIADLGGDDDWMKRERDPAKEAEERAALDAQFDALGY